MWEKIYNGPGDGNNIAYSIALDYSGNIFIAGESKGLNNERDFVLIKYNNPGIEELILRYNVSDCSVEIPSKVVTDDMAIDQTGNFYVCGNTPGTGTVNDYLIIKYNSN